MLTVDQLAKELNVSPSLIYKKATAGEIPHYRVGSTLRFKLEEVLEALREVKA